VNEGVAKAAASAGYDSVQFLAHPDHVNYPCDSVSGLSYMGLEVLATKLVGTYACGMKDGAPAVIKAGWKASRSCICDNNQKTTNCQGVPVKQSGDHVVPEKLQYV